MKLFYSFLAVKLEIIIGWQNTGKGEKNEIKNFEQAAGGGWYKGKWADERGKITY